MKCWRVPLFGAMLLVGAMAGACGSDDGDSAGAAGAPARGTAKKGEPCTENVNCAEPSAVCVKGTTCSGPIDASAFTTECASGGAEQCAGLRCLVLAANKQNKTGICSMACTTDADCGGTNLGACVTISAGTTCLKPCSSSADCSNGFVCVPDPADSSRKACLAEAS